MNKTRKCVSVALLVLLFLVSGCKPSTFTPSEVDQGKALVERALQAFAANDVGELQECFVPTATGLPILVGDVRRTWFETLHASGVVSATIHGYQIAGFDVLENQPAKLTASVTYTGTYTFQYAQAAKSYVCTHQVQVTLVKYKGSILLSDFQQQGVAPVCRGVD
ncbi:hypothetical protein HPY42_01765 [Coprothermobacteraceae bacterium]|nr:hypothetical protein [Coprothermobacteraceae bacterium]